MKPFGDKYFSLIFYLDVMLIITLVVAIMDDTASVILPRYAENVIEEGCIYASKLFECISIFIKFLAIFITILEIVHERENSVDYENFMQKTKENCVLLLSELSCLDDSYENLTPEQFVSNARADYFREANLWSQLEKFLQRELQKALYEHTNPLRFKPPVSSRRPNFEYVYCSDLTKWSIPNDPLFKRGFRSDMENESLNSTFNEKTTLLMTNGSSGPVAFKDVPNEDF